MQLRIVLARVRNPLNIGAAARAMANFGFRDLALVKPYEGAWREASSAVGAEELLAGARVYPSVIEALADRTLVAGTTSGTRRKLPGGLLQLAELAARIPANARLALLFGSEKTGLSNEELSFCHLFVRIPTAPGCPSMNLGQAVAVCCYELARSALPSAKAQAPEPAPLGELELFRGELEELLRAAGYFSWGDYPKDPEKLRRLLLRLRLSHHDLTAIRGMLTQIRWKLGEKRD